MGLVTWLLVVKQRGTFSAYLATYGLLIPVAIGAPIALIRTLDVRNAILMISVGGPFSLAVFRFLEGVYVMTSDVQLSRTLVKKAEGSRNKLPVGHTIPLTNDVASCFGFLYNPSLSWDVPYLR